MNNGKKPWDKWFWSDYLGDQNLLGCSLSAQGLWMRMLGIMDKSTPRGFLIIPDSDSSKSVAKALSKLVGAEEPLVKTLIDELGTHGVYSKTNDGIIFNRRMARESYISKVRSVAGRMGGLQTANTHGIASASASASDSYLPFLTKEEEGVIPLEEPIQFNRKKREWTGITALDMDGWRITYPAVDVEHELNRMREWLLAHPEKNYSQYRRFIVNWLSRTQDRGGSRKGPSPAKPSWVKGKG